MVISDWPEAERPGPDATGRYRLQSFGHLLACRHPCSAVDLARDLRLMVTSPV
jgi:hypothetical protein